MIAIEAHATRITQTDGWIKMPNTLRATMTNSAKLTRFKNTIAAIILIAWTARTQGLRILTY